MASAILIYDGCCPFCSSYARYVRLKKTVGEIRLVDARKGGPDVDRAMARGCDLDEGMVLVMNGAYYHGDACLNRLALMSSKSGLFNRVNFALFRSPSVSRFGYPILRFGRKVALTVLGRSKLGR